jgi:hypothetical protein
MIDCGNRGRALSGAAVFHPLVFNPSNPPRRLGSSAPRRSRGG